MRKFIYLFILLLLINSCDIIIHNDGGGSSVNEIEVKASVQNFVNQNKMPFPLMSDSLFQWQDGDQISIFSNAKDCTAQTMSSLMLTLSEGDDSYAWFTNKVGWSLIRGGRYNYIAIYPYSISDTRDKIIIDYTGQVQSSGDLADNLHDYDYMYSDATDPISDYYAEFSFNHISSFTEFTLQMPDVEKSIFKMSLIAESQIFGSSASYSIDDIALNGKPTLDIERDFKTTLSFGESGIQPIDSAINARIMMLPAKWANKEIKVKLYTKNNNAAAYVGSFIPETDQVAGTYDKYYVKMEARTDTIIPHPKPGEYLHVLLLGHSFGEDCTEFLPKITKSAGVDSVHYGRFYQANCSLAQHWGHVSDNDYEGSGYSYMESDPKTGLWSNHYNVRTLKSVLGDCDWDVVVFQDNIGFGAEGNYTESNTKHYLDLLTGFISNYYTNKGKEIPVYGWNMFWGYNEDRSVTYDKGTRGAEKMWEAIVNCAKQIKQNVPQISLFVATGTALQNARGTSLNDPGSAESPSKTQLLIRYDHAQGIHASFGIGRYVTACTFFQTLVTPVYGVDISESSFYPEQKDWVLRTGYNPSTGKWENQLHYGELSYSFDGDQITTREKAMILFKCAKSASTNPFEVTHIDE